MRRFGKRRNAKRLSVGETGAGGYHKPSATSRMSDIATLIVVAALADNIVLSKMLGLCPFIGTSKQPTIAAGVGVATMAVLTAAAAAAFAVDEWITIPAWRPLVFIALAAGMVQAAELFLKLFLPLLHRALGLYLPLIATNCAVLGIMLLAAQKPPESIWQAAGLGLGGGLGFFLALTSFALLRENIVTAKTPPLFRGAPLAMISAGWMALAFSPLIGAFP